MKKIKVLVCRPNTAPQVEEIENSLDSLQSIVGGLVQAIYPHDDDSCILLNDEGKIIGLPVNRPLLDENGDLYDIMVGNIIIVRAPEDSEDFESLTDEQISIYSKKYADYIKEDEAWRFGAYSPIYIY